MEYIFIGLWIFALTVFFTFFAIRFFPRLGLVDRPEKYHLQRKPIPYYGGLVLFVVFVLSVFLFLDIDVRLLGVILAVFLIVAVSFLDDFRHVSPLVRLGIQIFAALVLVAFGVSIDEIRNPLGGVFDLTHFEWSFSFGPILITFGLLSTIFTVFWVVLIMNTVNFLDGLNGLASGVSSIAFFVLFVLSIRPAFHTIDQSVFAVLSFILAVSALSFAFFEFAPAKILMGDTGSMFLGFMLAVMGIFSGGKIATAFLVLGFPILDAFWVILRRLYQKKSPIKGDLQHLHHRFLQAGFTERQALLVIYLICAIFGAIALFLETFEKIIALFFMIAFMIIVGVFLIFRAKKNL